MLNLKTTFGLLAVFLAIVSSSLGREIPPDFAILGPNAGEIGDLVRTVEQLQAEGKWLNDGEVRHDYDVVSAKSLLVHLTFSETTILVNNSVGLKGTTAKQSSSQILGRYPRWIAFGLLHEHN